MMVKTQKRKRSPKEVIESEKKPHLEQYYFKKPGEEIIPIGVLRHKSSARPIGFKVIPHIWKAIRSNKRNLKLIHTHPSSPLPPKYVQKLNPSYQDLYGFLTDDTQKTEIIAQQNPSSGKLEGYHILRKTRHTPKNLNPKQAQFKANAKFAKSMHVRGDMVNSFSQIYKLKNKIIPAPGYKYDPNKCRFVKETGLEKSLETQLASIIAIVGIGASIFFLQSNLTGFTISNLTQQTSNIIGISLFIIGLIGSLYYFKRKR